MLRNLGIRSKLFGLVVVPMVVLVALAAVVVGDASGNARRADQVRQLTDTSVLLNSVVHALQNERRLAYETVVDRGDRAETTRQRAHTDKLVAQLRAALTAVPLDEVSRELDDAGTHCCSAARPAARARAELDRSAATAVATRSSSTRA
jgi:hypothetical protein